MGPLQITFDSSMDLLKTDKTAVTVQLKQYKAVLEIFERISSSWTTRRLQHSNIAKSRNDRLAVKELIDFESKTRFRKSFRRNRGHRIVLILP